MTAANEAKAILQRLGVPGAVWSADGFEARSPIDGSVAGRVAETPDLDAVAARATAAFHQWKRIPAPRSIP